MKKLYALFILFVLFAIQAQAAGIYTTVASGTVTQANMKISAVDGTAFVDFGAANVLTTKLGHLLKIRDSSGRAIQGYIKAAGTGETLGDELIAASDDRTFSSDTGWWTKGTGWTINDAVAGKANHAGTTYSSLVKTSLLTLLALYKLGHTLSGAMNFGSAAITGATSYRVALYVNIVFATGVSGSTIDDVSVKQVLTPSSTGVTIVSSKGGTTYNWATKNSAFNYNDYSGYTYEIIKVRQAVLMDSDACLNANATINLTDGSATWACAGIDDSAFQDGKHMITVSDATGKTVLGYYENAGSGDVVNTKSGSTNNWIWKDASFSTAGDYTRKIYYVGD